MKFFADLREALKHVAESGQALHYSCPKAPACFKGKRLWGHLLDGDRKRLVATARALGVRVIRVHRPGEPRQHVDLCGKPLGRAMRMCLGLWAQEGETP
jgi:hypothetical protein